jgi:hypothetical protein
MTGCPCRSDLNTIVCRSVSCGWSGRFIDSAPFIVGAIAILACGGFARFTIDRLLDRANPRQSDTADYADFISEATGLVGGLLTFVIGVIVVASADNLSAAIVLLCVLAIVPLWWISWGLISNNDPFEYGRKKRGHSLSWRSYALTAATALAVVLVFLIL